jgi:hypothetical protein
MSEMGKTGRIITIIFTVILAAVMLFNLTTLILSGARLTMLIISIILVVSAVIVLAVKKNLIFILSLTAWLITIPIMGLSLLFPPFIHSYSPWKYNFQREYIEKYNGMSSKDFPSVLPRDIKNYEFDYAPSIMQGTGHCSARFKASADVIKAYESQYAPQAIYTIPLENFSGGMTTIEKISPEAKQSYAEDKSLDIWSDDDFWADTDATVYVISAVHNWNHPHSSAVIISKDKSKIQFTQLG